MGDTWGNRIKLTIFGESHGPAVGIVIDGLPAGETIDMELVEQEMARRAPGQSEFATARQETDAVEILSGVTERNRGRFSVAPADSATKNRPLLRSTGSTICAVIRNNDAHSSDYDSKLRPGHADWTALLKHHGFADMRGGGHFSGRLTAPLVFAGAVAKQVLARRGVSISARAVEIAGQTDEAQMHEAILAAKADGDSVGGIIEVTASGVPGGLGDPFFWSLESVAASLFFSIPAVKAVEFGDGFALARQRGSQANDELLLEERASDATGAIGAIGAVDAVDSVDARHYDYRNITAASNHNGGILGGISNGMPVVARLAIKPTASIAKAQCSVDAATMTPTVVQTQGRHDPCIVPRAVPVVEAALALSILDCMDLGPAINAGTER